MPLKYAAAIAATLVLSACATSKPYWHKENVSADDTYTQLSECRFQVGLSRVSKSEREELVAHCMRGKGFRLLRGAD